MKIQYKASSIMAIFGFVIVLLLSGWYEFQHRKTIVGKELHNIKNISDEISLHLDSNLKELASVGVTLSSAPVIKNALLKSNSELSVLPEARRKQNIDTRNKQWRKTSDINDPFIQGYMTNPVAEFLKVQQTILPERYGEIFLTNRYGAMIATTGKLTTLAHAHKYWWEASYDDGRGRIFLDDRGFDTSVKGYVLGVVIPIKDGNEIIGILKCNVNIIGPLTDVIKSFNQRHPGKLQIVRTGGLIVSEHGVTPLSGEVSMDLVEKLQKREGGTSIITENNQNQLVAFSSVGITMGSDEFGFGGSKESIDHLKGNKGEGWHIVTSLSEENAIDASDDTFLLIIIIGTIFTLLTTLVALILGKLAANPIVELAATAQILGEGDLAARGVVRTNDEIGSLAKSLNKMAEELQGTMTSRDELINEIEERKKVERLLTRFKVTLDRTLDCVFIFDPETLRLSYVNQGAVNQVGYSIGELLQMTPLDIKPEFNEPQFREMMDKIINSQAKTLTFETVHQHKNGTLIPVEISLQYIELEDKHRFISFVRDITLQKRAKENLRKLNEELEERIDARTAELETAKDEAEAASRAKGIFIANMSHEFRTPLNAVLGFSQLMLDDQSVSDEHREYINIINRSGRLQLSLINDVLAMSSLENGQTTFKPQTLDLTKLLKDVIDMEKVAANAKNIFFNVEYTSEIPQFIYSDYEKLQQIITNVIDNAIKFTESGGVTLHIGASPTESDEFMSLVCDVEDSGIGIPVDLIERIFMPFVQIAEQTNQSGTGLGLTLVKRFLALMDGEISVDSELGRGSTFQITIPVKVTTDAAFRGEEIEIRNILAIEPDGKEYRILVVDDDEDGRVLLRETLESVGYSVREAASGPQAIDIFKEWRPQMIWMDMHMPNLGGMDTTRRIRALEGGSEITIAALTAFPLNEMVDGRLPSGLDEFVTKPFKQSELFGCMAKHLGLSYQYDETIKLPSEPKERGMELTSGELDILPDEVLAELRDAVFALDVEHAIAVSARIGNSNPELGDALLTMVSNLDFTTLQRLIKSRNQ